ncbi:hypothetical protein OCH239_18930 [Roseivivax halodurans JCM 10272]|uniref:Uncharacterized protein n=1 Tax=Roseivivax halodurans JCM 10272 TaxID=1449350 RepID=X7E808_9RHOB|nr:hypothetical protein [Roseivivax halodurans]ETX11960.1 hypothetical protein OCH239_18930 [Roseivivax halodurans JCM 10272]
MKPQFEFENYRPRQGLAGRYEEQFLLDRYFDDLRFQEDYNLLFLTGRSGIGKTTMIETYRNGLDGKRSSKEKNKRQDVAIGLVDFSNPDRRTAERGLAQIRASLSANHPRVTFPCFDLALTVLFKESNPEKDIEQEYPRIFSKKFNLIGEELLDWTAEWAVDPAQEVVGAVSGFANSGFLKGMVMSGVHRILKHHECRDVREPMERIASMPVTEIRRLLPDILAHDIRRMSAKRPDTRLLLIADSLEQTQEVKWLQRLIQQTKGIDVLVSSREMPDWGEQGFHTVVQRVMPLPPVGAEDLDEYLAAEGIDDPHARDSIVRYSRGHPQKFELLKSRYLSDPDLATISDVFQNELSEVSSLPQEERNRLGLISMAVPLDRETYDALKLAYPSYLGSTDWDTFFLNSYLEVSEDGVLDMPATLQRELVADFRGREPSLFTHIAETLHRHLSARCEAITRNPMSADQIRLWSLAMRSLRIHDPDAHIEEFGELCGDLIDGRQFEAIFELRKFNSTRWFLSGADGVQASRLEHLRICELVADMSASKRPRDHRHVQIAYQNLSRLEEDEVDVGLEITKRCSLKYREAMITQSYDLGVRETARKPVSIGMNTWEPILPDTERLIIDHMVQTAQKALDETHTTDQSGARVCLDKLLKTSRPKTDDLLAVINSLPDDNAAREAVVKIAEYYRDIRLLEAEAAVSENYTTMVIDPEATLSDFSQHAYEVNVVAKYLEDADRLTDVVGAPRVPGKVQLIRAEASCLDGDYASSRPAFRNAMDVAEGSYAPVAVLSRELTRAVTADDFNAVVEVADLVQSITQTDTYLMADEKADTLLRAGNALISVSEDPNIAGAPLRVAYDLLADAEYLTTELCVGVLKSRIVVRGWGHEPGSYEADTEALEAEMERVQAVGPDGLYSRWRNDTSRSWPGDTPEDDDPEDDLEDDFGIKF